MAFNPTQTQKNAIDARDSSVLVSAGAGSGKTKVLTERLIGFLTDPEHPANIDSFLIITFTKAAAEELRGRILKAISEKLESEPGSKFLRRQLALVSRAWIGTIHSFCGNVIRENSLELGISPDFKVLDDDRSKLMFSSALERVLESFYSEPDKHPGFLHLADSFGAGRDDRGLSGLVSTLYGKMQSHAFPEKWAEGCAAAYEKDYSGVDDTPWGATVLDYYAARLEYLDGLLQKAYHNLEELGIPGCPLGDNILEKAEFVRNLSRACRIGWDCAHENIEIEFPTVRAPRGYKDVPEYKEAKEIIYEGIKKELKENIFPILSLSSEDILADIRSSAVSVRALTELTLAVSRAFAEDKRRAGVLDFNDLEHFAAKLLIDEETEEPTAVAKRLSARFTEVMVDEYQDVSPVQDSLFRAVAKHNPQIAAKADKTGKDSANEILNLFSVGDIKQAIYRFRLADPKIFAEKNSLYSDYTDKNPENSARKIYLRENFRSRSEVLDAVNTVFSCVMSTKAGGVEYDETQRLVYGADYPGKTPVPELIIRDGGSDIPGESENPEGEAEDTAGEEGTEQIIKQVLPEAEMTAKLIKKLITVDKIILRDGREASAGDFAILLRDNKSIELYGNALAAEGIEVSSGRGGEFFTSPEISAVAAMISVLDNPHQDIPLLTVLTCPAFGFSPDDLSRVRSAKKRTDLYNALCLAAESDEKAKRAVEKINSLRLTAADLSPVALVGRIINALDLIALCSAMPNGAQRRANLLYLTELAQSFAESGSVGLHSFVGWLSRKAERGDTPAAVSEASAGGVKIMTMHKSKGLQFPVVFVCGLGKQLNCRDAKGDMLIHKDLGFGPVMINTEKRYKYKSIAHRAINIAEKQEYISEEMRLLYVALTRAEERLFMTACVKDAEKLLDKAPAVENGVMNYFEAASAGCAAQWIMRAAEQDAYRTIGVSVYNKEDYAPAQAGETAETVPDSEVLAELERRLGFEYAHRLSETLPSKVTATELKGFEEKPENDENDSISIAPKKKRFFRRPDLGGAEKPATGAERGTATHLVLQYMRFSEGGGADRVNAEIARLEREGFISKREAQSVDAESIVGLFSSELGGRMLGAGDRLRREFRFSLLIDARELDMDAPAGEQTLLQGVVDCAIEEDDGIVIIDYKTDGVFTPEEIDARAAFYAGQVKTYAKALERILEKPVKECVLYFLRPGRMKSIKIPEIPDKNKAKALA